MPQLSLPDFLDRWSPSGGAERSNYQLFLSELCDLLAVPRPNPAVPDESKNTYVFDRHITLTHPDGSTSPNFIDLYKRAHFVLETKQGIEAAQSPLSGADAPVGRPPAKLKKGHGTRGTKLWDDSLLRAKSQAENYVRSIPDDNPPFLLVVDVGYSIETYADFSGLGKTYTPFPDNLSHRFKLTDLADPKRGADLLARLQKIFTDPHSLNPARRSAKVTRDIASKLAELSKSLEKSKHDPESVAHFLMRVLFTLFAEDVGLIPNHAFTNLLKDLESTPQKFAPMAMAVWQNMDKGGFSPVLREDLLRFNGGLFADTQALPLTGQQLALLIEAAKQDWSDVEPAIFGTLLERALHPTERHKLGAHYTPRAYVERLVLPTVIEPLREEWQTAQSKAVASAKKGKTKDAVKTIGDFLKHLCSITVLDPACGSGNFLYVTLEHLKRLEGEVHDFLHTNFENTQLPLEYTGLTVDPHQLRGIEINPRAAAITDLVLWIGYLQWHFRTHGQTMPAEPVLKKFDNIECRDAVLAYDKKELARDEHGKPLSRWDGTTTKTHPVTGEQIPDDSARTPIYTYTNTRKALWHDKRGNYPEYVVGNPPFIGGWKIRQSLGDGYVDSLWKTYPDLPEKTDFVMFWWDLAATLLKAGRIKRFGFITTNSITMIFQRRVLEKYLSAEDSNIRLQFAIADHPWVDTQDSAAVRIAMTVCETKSANPSSPAWLGQIAAEDDDPDHISVVLKAVNLISPVLSAGANTHAAKPLQANADLISPGVQLYGAGFIVEEELAEKWMAYSRGKKLPTVIKPYLNGRDLMGTSRRSYVIDFFGMERDEAAKFYPEALQRVIDLVKPERDLNRRESIRTRWWRFGWERPKLRAAVSGLERYIVTPETSKHRVFVFLNAQVLPDNKLWVFAFDDAYFLGVMSSRIHTLWALITGGRLEDRPVYNKATCFDPFPFPDCSEKQKQKIRDIAEELDAHRKRQQAKFPDLTLTDMYNVLEKLRAIDAGKLSAADFSPKDKKIHDHALLSILKQLHTDLDTAVFAAYGWAPDLSDDQLLEKLVTLNHQRAAEEKRGKIKYLRPDFQNPA